MARKQKKLLPDRPFPKLKNGPKRPKMAQNGPKMAPKWPEMARSRAKIWTPNPRPFLVTRRGDW